MTDLYKVIYLIGKKIPKRDRFGIYARLDDVVLNCLTLSIQAALASGIEKVGTLKLLRTHIDVAKRLIRLCHELEIIEEKKYFSLQEKLLEASKMAAGWLSYLTRKEPSQKGPSLF